ncbi:MAG: hypothetical protein ACRBM6_33530 [Geminicoccales bacterium]
MRRADDWNSSLQREGRSAYETWTVIYDAPKILAAYLGELLCRIGIHDLRLIEVVSGFGVGGPVEKFKCTRCGKVMTRRGA